MTENSGGVGKPNDFTYFNLIREAQIGINDRSLENNASAAQETTSKPPAEKDILEWKLGANLYSTNQKDKLKLQIQDSKDRLAEGRKGSEGINKPRGFIGKVTYELEGHPDLGNSSGKFSIDDLG